MLRITSVLAFSLLAASVAAAQTSQQNFTDPLALLGAVAEKYTEGVDTFHMESITESVQNGDLEHSWRKVYRTAIKGPGKLYRIETRSATGSYVQDSDGTNEWVYLREANVYVKRPLPQNWPQFAQVVAAGYMEVSEAWQMRTWLEADAEHYNHATLLPQETILIEGHSYPCYVVHVTSEDSTLGSAKEVHWDRTFWIDKSALVFRKQVEHNDNYLYVTPTVHIPFHQDVTTVYPVADFSPKTTPQMFQFVPPTGARQVAVLGQELHLPPVKPVVSLAGTMAPEISFFKADGSKISLSAYRGKPLLLDLWATWCGPCLLSMPTLNRIYNDFKKQGLAVVTIDQDAVAKDATQYLAHHGYDWTNYHDEKYVVSQAFKAKGIPLTILIDAQGKIVYYDFGGDEGAIRKALAALGPEFSR